MEPRTLVNAFNEWDPLQECIVGIADYSMFPSEDKRMIEATMPGKDVSEFRQRHPFPSHLVERAKSELDHFAKLLEAYGVRVFRPSVVDWNKKTPSYTAAMVRAAILPVGNKVIEAPMAWKSRKHEYLAYESLFSRYSSPSSNSIVIRRPSYDPNQSLLEEHTNARGYIINESRPAFDAADFVRVGHNALLGQFSHVTNTAGVDLLRKCLQGTGVRLYMLETTNLTGMHIDTTLMPLRDGLMMYHPERISVETLQSVRVLTDWIFIALPDPMDPENNPFFMNSPCLNMNVLSLDSKHVFIEAQDDTMADLLLEHGMIPIRVPFQAVQSLGGSFHAATVDIRRAK